METTSDSLFLGAFMLVSASFVIPIASIGSALSFHLLRLPPCPPAYVGFLAKQNDPDRPTNLIARALFGRHDLQQPHSIHVMSGFVNVFSLLLCNALPLVSNVVHNQYHTPGPLLGFFTASFFVCEGLWFLWFLRFVSRNRDSQ